MGSHFTLSPATKATRRVLNQRDERRTSVDAQHQQHSAGQHQAKDVVHAIPAPIQRWTTANRMG